MLNRTLSYPIVTETSLNSVHVVYACRYISSRLQATEHSVDEVRADKTAEAAHRSQISPCTQQTTETSRVHACRQQIPDVSQQVTYVAVADISDAVRAQVANHMRGAPMMDFITSDEDPESGEKATTAPRKKALKSGKIRTTNSSVLHKVIWPHEVVYVLWESQLSTKTHHSTFRQWLPGSHGS